MPETPWTPERLAALEQLVSDGLTYREIGARLGMTKNQCLCKATRMGFKPLSTVVLTPQQQLMREREKRERSTTLARLAALDLFPGYGKCVFPIGHPGTPEFRFCGEVLPDPAHSYCAGCESKAFISQSLQAASLSGWTPERKAQHRAMMLARHGS